MVEIGSEHRNNFIGLIRMLKSKDERVSVASNLIPLLHSCYSCGRRIVRCLDDHNSMVKLIYNDGKRTAQYNFHNSCFRGMYSSSVED